LWRFAEGVYVLRTFGGEEDPKQQASSLPQICAHLSLVIP
jgi:hypothetical protein